MGWAKVFLPGAPQAPFLMPEGRRDEPPHRLPSAAPQRTLWEFDESAPEWGRGRFELAFAVRAERRAGWASIREEHSRLIC